jgi:hypothetical protein
MASTTIDPDALLSDCLDVPVYTRQPSPLSVRLDELVALADKKGARTNRSEMIGALILAAREAPEDLFDRVIEYRQAPARAAAIKVAPGANVLEFKRQPRGPRKKSSSG